MAIEVAKFGTASKRGVDFFVVFILFLDSGCYFFVVASLGIQESKQVRSTVINFHRLIYVRCVSIRISIFIKLLNT